MAVNLPITATYRSIILRIFYWSLDISKQTPQFRAILTLHNFCRDPWIDPILSMIFTLQNKGLQQFSLFLTVIKKSLQLPMKFAIMSWVVKNIQKHWQNRDGHLALLVQLPFESSDSHVSTILGPSSCCALGHVTTFRMATLPLASALTKARGVLTFNPSDLIVLLKAILVCVILGLCLPNWSRSLVYRLSWNGLTG